jgi:hypothetical protein
MQASTAINATLRTHENSGLDSRSEGPLWYFYHEPASCWTSDRDHKMAEVWHRPVIFPEAHHSRPNQDPAPGIFTFGNIHFRTKHCLQILLQLNDAIAIVLSSSLFCTMCH